MSGPQDPSRAVSKRGVRIPPKRLEHSPRQPSRPGMPATSAPGTCGLQPQRTMGWSALGNSTSLTAGTAKVTSATPCIRTTGVAGSGPQSGKNFCASASTSNICTGSSELATRGTLRRPKCFERSGCHTREGQDTPSFYATAGATLSCSRCLRTNGAERLVDAASPEAHLTAPDGRQRVSSVVAQRRPNAAETRPIIPSLLAPNRRSRWTAVRHQRGWGSVASHRPQRYPADVS